MKTESRIVEPNTIVRRYLVVANQTAASPSLLRAVRERVERGPSSLHVVVPATAPYDYMRLAALSVDPLSGGFIPGLPGVAEADDEALVQAHERLDELLGLLALDGIAATGHVGSADPMEAIVDACTEAEYDEIVLSTLPASVSRWLKMDLPARVQRRFAVPVTPIIADAA